MVLHILWTVFMRLCHKMWGEDKSEWYRKEKDDSEVDVGLEKASTKWRGSLRRGSRAQKTILMNDVKVRIGAVLFVPKTQGGQLAKLIRKEVDTMAPSFGWSNFWLWECFSYSHFMQRTPSREGTFHIIVQFWVFWGVSNLKKKYCLCCPWCCDGKAKNH